MGLKTENLEIWVASIRSNFEMWRKGEIKDGAFSWHLQNNLLQIEKELADNNRQLDDYRKLVKKCIGSEIFKEIEKEFNKQTKHKPKKGFNVNPEDLPSAPEIIQKLWACKVSGTPISVEMLDEAHDKHPEYFN